jgi:hypothetical protein
MALRALPILLGILLTVTLFTASFPSAASQPTYSEDVSVTVIGSSTQLSITMRGENVSLTGLNNIESVADSISGYSLSYMDSSRWVPEFELFSNAGYDIIGFEAIPPSGIFLKVTSLSSDNASDFADSLGRLLKLRFTLFSIEGDHYTFYSHMDPGLVTQMWSAVPTDLGGAALLMDQLAFNSQEVPIFRFSGERVDGGFEHSVTISGLKSNAVSAQSSLKLSDILPTILTVNSSSAASSSSITVRVIGGFVTYSDTGLVTNFIDNRSSRVTVSAEPGNAFPDMSIDLAQSFPSVIATRTIDRAALNEGDIVTVGVRIKNAASLGSTAISNITVNDNWWMIHPEIEFVDGEYSRSLGHLAAGGEFTIAYRIKIVSSAKGEVLAPLSDIVYSYPIANSTVQETAKMNQLLLVLNDIKPAINVEASIESVDYPLLASIPVNLTIRNNGNGHATNLEVAGNSRQSLLSGDVWQISVNLPRGSLTDLQASGVWMVSWDQGNQRREISSNSISVYYGITGSEIPNFTVDRSIIPTLAEGTTRVSESVSINNTGSIPLDSVTLSGVLPDGFSYLSGNYTQQGDALSAYTSGVAGGEKAIYGYTASVSNLNENYIIPPTIVVIESAGLRLNRIAAMLVVPLGVQIVKDFEPLANFVEANVTINARIVNTGSEPIFGVAFNIGTDTFLNITEGQTILTKAVLNKNESLILMNQGTLISTGHFAASRAVAIFTIGGQTISSSSEEAEVDIYRPIYAELTIDQTNPVEGQEFTAVLTVRNPSAVTVRNVNIAVDLPSGLSVISGSIQLTGEELAPNATETKAAKLSADAPFDFSIGPPTVSFTYDGRSFKGASTPLTISVLDNATMRYGIPLGVTAILILLTVLIARRTVSSKAD